MRKNLLLLSCAVCISVCTKAQTPDPTIISSAGGTAKTSSYSLDWTMGEYAVETLSTSGGLYTQGFNQPLFQVTATTSAVTRSSNSYNISIAPNPVVSILNFKITSQTRMQVFVTVADIHGIIFIQRTVSTVSGSLQIDMHSLPAGTYTLTVRDGVAAHVIKTYQIIKG